MEDIFSTNSNRTALMRACDIDPLTVRQYFERDDLLDAWEEIRDSL